MGKFLQTILCCSISFLKTLGRKMKSFFVLATLAFVANAAKVFPPGVNPAECPNYPFCEIQVPNPDQGLFPTPADVELTQCPDYPYCTPVPFSTPTLFWQQAQLVT